MEQKFYELVTPLTNEIRAEIKAKATRSEIMENIDRLNSKIQSAVEKTTNITLTTKQNLRKEMFNKVDLTRFNEVMQEKAL